MLYVKSCYFSKTKTEKKGVRGEKVIARSNLNTIKF